MEELKTGYEWCLRDNVRLLHLAQWDSQWAFFAESYYKEKITYDDFLGRLRNCEIKRNSTPRKTAMFLEYRMFGLVPYNLSPIQQGIQYGHAVVEYQQMVKSIPQAEEVYDKWANEDKTFIILNGYTTNENPERLGSMQKHLATLKDNGILVAEFREPDLNDTLTGVAFLVDERVFNRELYPDFVSENPLLYANGTEVTDRQYEAWKEKVGGDKNVFLRTFLPQFKLA